MEFQAWPKTTRLFRDIVITEKIDGTNACIIFEPIEGDRPVDYVVPGEDYVVGAQSRNRLIVPSRISGDKSSDNYGFAEWVYENRSELFELLGPGRHYGEWWGQSIARKYGMDVKVFSLFNTEKHSDLIPDKLGDAYISTVPVLYKGEFDQAEIEGALIDLQRNGSSANPGFMSPEGICVYHTQSKVVQKVTLDNNDKGKWEANG